MTEIENNENLELDNNEEDVNPEEEKPKPKLTPEQVEGIKRRQFTKLAKELGIELPKKPEAPVEQKKEGFDYGELAYLTAKGVPEDDHDWLLEGTRTTGKELKDLLKSEWVQKDLKERLTERAADAAIPSGTKRSQGGTHSEDSVEYWVAKDLQPPEHFPISFRKKVLDARQKKVVDGDKFAKNSIIAPGFPLG